MKQETSWREAQGSGGAAPRGLIVWVGLLGTLAVGCPLDGDYDGPPPPPAKGEGSRGKGVGGAAPLPPPGPYSPPEGQGGVGTPTPPWSEPSFEGIPFETPTWFPAGGQTPPSPRAEAGLTFYGGEQNCAVLFGGYDVGPAGRRLRNDVDVRCEGEWQRGVAGATPPVPAPRQSVAFAFAPFSGPGEAGAYLFGGKSHGHLWGDFWRLELRSLPDGARRLSWTPVAPPEPPTESNWPSPRTGAGLIADGESLLLFGGEGPDGALLDDTWRFDGAAWTRLCAGHETCFPARRGFTALPRSFGSVAKAVSFGGADPGDPFYPHASNDIFSFVGEGWSSSFFSSAAWGTDEDGQYDIAGGYVLPWSRLLAWGAMTAGGQALVGSGERGRGGHEALTDLWRIETRENGTRWARVPASARVPGPRVGASAVYDPVRKETLVVGGALSAPGLDGELALNPMPPVAYRGEVGTASATVTCLGVNADGDCSRFRLEARAELPGGASPRRVRAYFARDRGLSVRPVGPECGLPDAPISADDDGTLRCEAGGSFDDRHFVIHLQDGAFARGGSLCSDEPGPGRAYCNEPDAYPRILVCPSFLTPESGAVRCE